MNRNEKNSLRCIRSRKYLTTYLHDNNIHIRTYLGMYIHSTDGTDRLKKQKLCPLYFVIKYLRIYFVYDHQYTHIHI